MSLTTTIKQGSDLYFLYTFLKRLTTPFNKSKAYELGIIDEKGKVLRKRNTLKTSEERAAYTLMDTLIFNMKKLMAKIPFGSSKLMSYAASLFLLKERNNLQIYVNTELLQEKFEDFCNDKRDSVKFLNECNVTHMLFEQLDFDEEEIEEDAPANATGTAVPGTGDDSSTVIPKKKKKKKPNVVQVEPRKFMLFNLYKEHIEDIDELDIITGVGKDLMNLYDLLPEQEIFIENLKTGEQIDIRTMLQNFSIIEKSAFGKNLKRSFTKNRQKRTTLGSIRRAAKTRSVTAIQGVRG